MKEMIWALVITVVVGAVVWGTLGLQGGKRAAEAGATHSATPAAPAANATAIAIATATAASGGTGGTPDGKALATQLGCAACHSTSGAAGVGPTWKGLAGARVELADGKTVTADDAFLKESIVAPNATLVKGYAAGLMPATFASLPEAQVTALVEYIKTLK